MDAVGRAFSVRRYFEEHVGEWSVDRYHDATYVGRGEAALRWLRRRPPGRVLDVGCGAGHQSLGAVRAGHEVVAVDFAFEMARATRDRLRRDAPAAPCMVVVADALHPPFRDGTFDVVLALGVVGFVTERCRLLTRFHDLLRAGGELICDTALPERRVLLHALSLPTGGARARADAPEAPGFYSRHFTKHSPEEFEGLLESGGFRAVARRGAGFGTLRVGMRTVLPWRVEMWLTRVLNRLSGHSALSWLARHALIYVVRSVRRSGAPGTGPARVDLTRTPA
jgi:ubiquinone/menaquinone biosynthesis C-methylase UbiE